MDDKPTDTQNPLDDKSSFDETSVHSANPAADLIRKKLSSIFEDEPNVKEEVTEVDATTKLSKHQKFIKELSTSGKDLATIQTAWHQYYIGLPDKEKHEVWQEFYTANQNSSYQHALRTQQAKTGVNPNHANLQPQPLEDHRKIRSVRKNLKDQIKESAAQKLPGQLRSLIFGLSIGAIVIIVFLFSFFNQIIIAPFIQPSRHVGSLPLIISSVTVPTNNTPEVIIPKINVEIPVNYSLTSDNEATIETALEDGVIHYPSTVNPGENGNAAFFGHSSNNIFNPGQYKFAFVLLHALVKGDTFYLTYQQKVYVYQVINTQVVSPSDVAVLNDTEGNAATATLITCDPPGTSINRLVVTGVQISPDPSTNSAATYNSASTPTELANNGPSLWSRLWNDIF
jgi:sortase A